MVSGQVHWVLIGSISGLSASLAIIFLADSWMRLPASQNSRYLSAGGGSDSTRAAWPYARDITPADW